MTSSGVPLREQFNSARREQIDLDTLDPRTDEHKTILRSAIGHLDRCRETIVQLALFSPNEELDDVATPDIQFLAVDYLTAELLLKSYGDDRKRLLDQALDLFENFLSQLDHYNILSASNRKLLEQFHESKTSFTLASSTNAEERRKVKVARFQEEKALKAKLEYLRNKTREIHVDDATERSLYLAELALFSSQAFQSLDMIAQELAILSQMRFAEPAPQHGANGDRAFNGRDKDGYSEQLDGPLSKPGLGRPGGPLLSKAGKPLQPFTLTDKRTQLRQGVFKPGHNLPSMSIDEYLEEEKRRGGILDSDSSSNMPQAEPDEDNIAYTDAQTMKARDWDEFVEANPKGAGNTINRG